jgi:hypothetical protein
MIFKYYFNILYDNFNFSTHFASIAKKNVQNAKHPNLFFTLILTAAR